MRSLAIALFFGLLATCTFAAQRAPEIPRTVLSVAFSPDGKTLAAGAGLTKERGTVHLWDFENRKLIWKNESSLGIPTVAFAPDGRTLAVALYDKAAKLLDAGTGREIRVFSHPAEVRGVAFSPNGKLLASACWDGGARLWDIASGEEKLRVGGAKDRLRGVEFSPDGKLLMASGGSRGIKIWAVDGGAERFTLKHGDVTYGTQFSNDGAWLFSGSNIGTARLWDLKTGEARVIFDRFGSAYGLAHSANAQQLAACCSGSHQIYLYNLTLRDPTAKEQQHIAELIAKFNDDSYDVREATSKELFKIGFIAERQLSKAMKESPSAEVRIRCRTVREQMLTETRTQLYGHSDQVQCVAYSADGKLLASGSTDGTVRLWDVAAEKEIAKWSVD